MLDLAASLAPLVPVVLGHATVPGRRNALVLLATALLLCGDGLFGAGRSLGKRVFGLRAQALRAHRPANVREGLVRNAIFAAAVAPALFGVGLQICAVLLAFAFVSEAAVALRPLSRDLGQRRIGDLLAHTQVIDARTALRLPLAKAIAERAVAPAPLASRAARTFRTSPSKDTACASP